MNKTPHENNRSLLKSFFIALVIMLVLLIAWHLGLALFGITLVVSAGAWGFISAVVIALCIGTLLVFLLTGIGVIIVSVLAILGVICALFLLPFAFPLLIPVLIILLFVSFLRRRER